VAGLALSFDVLGLGCAAVDDLVYVASYPPANAKIAVRRRERHCGGLTATALVAAARLGARCAYCGVLGDDDLSEYVIERLSEEGIDVSLVPRRPGARPFASVIIVDEEHQTRNIFFDGQGVVAAAPDWPAAEVIRAARVLFVDHVGIDGAIRAAAIAREAGIPVVADIEDDASPRFSTLLSLIDHLIVSDSFAGRLSGEADPAAAVNQLWTDERNAVVVTCGAEGSWYRGTENNQPWHQPAYPVQAIDTTGCGDVFHGAYAAALARGLGLPERVRIASAAAALKATRRGGQAGIPTRAAVESFLGAQGQ
jgi:sugar/nucleoside kinase (ribokinase family)